MQLSAAFIKGAQFAIGANQLAQDAKAKKDEEIHWRTIGKGEEAHAVPIDGPEPTTKKAESKKAESKKAETKKAETKLNRKTDKLPGVNEKDRRATMNALKGPSLRNRWDEYQETHGKPLNASAVYNEYSSIEKEIKAAEAKNKYSKAELKKKIDNNAQSIRDAVNKIGYDGKDRYPLYEDVRRARVGDIKGQASDLAREVARELEQEAYNFNSWKGTDLNRLNAISQRASAAVIMGLEGVAHYADAENSEQAQAQFDDLKKVADNALQAVKDAGTIGWIDSHTDDRSHGDNVIKGNIKSIKLPTLRENLNDSGLRASQKEKMINLHAELEQTWNTARAKGSVVNQAIKTQLAKGTLSGEHASRYASTVDLDLRRIDNLTNDIAKTLTLSSKSGSTITPVEIVALEGKYAEIKELTRELDRINKQVRERN